LLQGAISMQLQCVELAPLVAQLVQAYAPGRGLYFVAVLAGTTDVDAITLSMAQYARGGDPQLAARAIIVAALSNTAVKTAMVAVLGGTGLAVDLVPRPARAGPVRATALGHEARQHAVERQAVVEAFLDQVDEIRDGLRRFVLEQFKQQIALGSFHQDSRQIVGRSFRLPQLLFLVPQFFV
jgi:hypothetical protein